MQAIWRLQLPLRFASIDQYEVHQLVTYCDSLTTLFSVNPDSYYPTAKMVAFVQASLRTVAQASPARTAQPPAARQPVRVSATEKRNAPIDR